MNIQPETTPLRLGVDATAIEPHLPALGVLAVEVYGGARHHHALRARTPLPPSRGTLAPGIEGSHG
jgi:hypothetical protein